MVTETSPVGTSVLHPDWPEARFNTSGMFAHDLLIMCFTDAIELDLNGRAPIESVHGSPPLPWNAGRLVPGPLDAAKFKSRLDFLYEKGIGYFPTFANHLITQADLANPTANYILQCIAKRPDLNGVIVSSDLLSQYLTEKYPALRQVASVIKVTLDGGAGRAEYYQRLGERFHRYGVHPDDARDLKLMDQLDRDKAEILVNENCVVNCPQRARHYDVDAKLQRAMGTPQRRAVQEELSRIVAGCRSALNMNRVGIRERNCNLTRSELKALYDMGFRHFNLQGRAEDPFTYAYDLVRFMLDPDFAAPRIHHLVSTWLSTLGAPNT